MWRRVANRVAMLAVGLASCATVTAGTGEVSPRLQAALTDEPAELHAAWVFFEDKGPDAQARLDEALAWLTPRALSRRERRGLAGGGVDLADLPVWPGYVQAVAARVTGLRHVSRWFNAVSVDA
jgi:hypothetical protein